MSDDFLSIHFSRGQKKGNLYYFNKDVGKKYSIPGKDYIGTTFAVFFKLF